MRKITKGTNMFIIMPETIDSPTSVNQYELMLTYTPGKNHERGGDSKFVVANIAIMLELKNMA